MRQYVLFVRGQAFDAQTVRTVRDDVEAIARCFGTYLTSVGGGSSSKHRALGAAGKALQKARHIRGEALLGYARRVHEQTTESSFSGGAVTMLDEGLRRLDALFERVPTRTHGEILRAVEHATYYEVKRRSVEFQEEWKDFVRREGSQFGLGEIGNDIPWFSKKLLDGRGEPAEKGEAWKRTAEEFLGRRKIPVVITDPEEE